ncbi:MAG TPA: hypothetical protein VNM40_00975 [Candidatus Paceibacterota bacterium]|nr:hypothetical protein [Candidatus Paceibacterota bacterium]
MFLIAAGVLVLVLLSGLIGYFYVQVSPMGTETPEVARYDSAINTPYRTLTTQNSDFAEGDRLYRRGSYTEARAAFERALGGATDLAQEAQVRYKIALSAAAAGDYAGAIAMYKDIAANGAYNVYVRAYAVQSIASTYYQYGHANPEIVNETFTGDPYASFAEDVDLTTYEGRDRAYRRVYEHALSIYPLATSAARVAYWYANEAILLHEEGDEEGVERYIGLVRARLAEVDADIERTRDDPNARVSIPGAIMRKGMTLATLAQLGEATLEDAEVLFKQAMDLHAINDPRPGLDGFERFLYAASLERYFGEDRHADIISLLAPFYTSDAYARESITPFLRAQRNADTWMHDSLANMSAIDPAFKTYLASLGWEDSDFDR